MSTVDEKASHDTVEISSELVVAIDLEQISGGHRKVGRLGHVARVDVRKGGRSYHILEGKVVCELMDPGIDGEAVD